MADVGLPELSVHGGAIAVQIAFMLWMLREVKVELKKVTKSFARHELEDQERLTRLETVVFPDMTPARGIKRPSGGFRALPEEEDT